jgi:hypothetical protein
MNSSSRSKLAASALMIAALGAVAALPATAGAKTGITLSIQTEADGFSGYVKSAKTKCHSGRKVTLYRKVSGPDKKAGSDTAQPNQDGSQWKISVSRAGTYYAVVSATSKCGGKTSKALKSKLEESEGASAAGDGPAAVKINLKRGTGDLKTSVLGYVFSADPACFDHRKVTFYRKTFASDRTTIIVRRIGYSYAERNTDKPELTRSLRFQFKLARSGTVIAKIPATDSCRGATSRNVPYTRP